MRKAEEPTHIFDFILHFLFDYVILILEFSCEVNL